MTRTFPAWTAICLASAVFCGCSKEAQMEKHLQRANEYYAADRYAEAEIEYSNVLKLAPTNAVAIRQLGFIYNDQGRPIQSYLLLKRAKELDPDNLDVRVKYGYALYAGGSAVQGREEALFILDKDPKTVDALVLLADTSYGETNILDAFQRLEQLRPQVEQLPGFHLALGTLHARQGDLAAAEKEFQKTLELDPKSAAGELGLGNIALSNNDLVKAEQHLKAAWDNSPYRSARRLRYVDFKIRTGKPDEGKAMLEEIANHAPDFLPAWNRLADLAYVQKRYDDALAVTEKILSKDNSSFEGNLIQGRVYLAKGETDKSIEVLERLASAYERLPMAHYQLALAYLQNRDENRAMASLNQAVNLNPDYGDAVMALAELNIRRGDPTAAIISLNKLLQSQAEVPRVYLLLASAYLGRDSADDAMTVYGRMAEKFPKDPVPLLMAGLLHVQNERPAQARQAFDAALQRSPDYLPAVEHLVNLDIAAKEYQTAIDRAQREVDKNPNQALPRVLLAKAYLSRENSMAKDAEAKGEAHAKNYQQAEAELKKAIELNNDFRIAYLMLARMYVDSGQHLDALKNLNDIVAKNPKDVTALMQIGMIHDQLKEYDKSSAAYEKLLKVNDRFSPALNNLAYLYSEHLADLDKAYEMARAARDLSPSDPFSADTLGWVLYKRKEYSRALGLLRESLGKLTDEPEVMYHVGMTHYMMGQEQEARLNLTKAGAADKEFPGKEEIPLRLANLDMDPSALGAQAIAQLEAALKKTPDDPILLAHLGFAQAQAGQPQKALKAYQDALVLNPNNVNAKLNMSRLYAETLNDKDKALDLAKQARDIDPGNPEVTYQVGKLAFDAGDHQWAFSLLRESSRNLSGKADVLYDLAWSYYSLGRLQEAQDTMNNVLQADPNFARAETVRNFTALTALALNPGSAAAAANQVQAVLAKDAGFVPAQFASALVLQQQGKASEARAIYEGILQKYDLFIPAHKQLAVLLVENLKDYAGAAVHANAAREGLPNDAAVARVLGIIMYEQNNAERAEQLLRESTGRDASNGLAYYYLGLAQVKLDKKPEAKAALEKAVTLGEGAGYVEAARTALRGLEE